MYLHKAYAAVPEIGKGRRWYDWPYRVFNTLLSSRLGKRMPSVIRGHLSNGLNYLLPYNELDRDRAWSREALHNLIVPPNERVAIPSLWIAEVFPPSEIHNLIRAIDDHGWDKKRVQFGMGEPNQEMLERSRQGAGWSWWRLGSIVDTSVKYSDFESQKQRLPPDFQHVDLVAVQFGSGLTVVLAHFHLSELGAGRVDRVWHAVREPRMVRGHGRPRTEDRLWSGIGETQESRRALHDLARGWMSGNCPGSFAHSHGKQPLMDLLLLNEHDPSKGERPDHLFNWALRALGITGSDVTWITFKQLPGLLLEQVDTGLCPELNGETTWTLWGQTDSVVTNTHNLGAYNGDRHVAIAHLVDDSMSNFFARLSMSHFLRLKTSQNASLRDTARSRHGRFSRRDLQRLRDSFLTSSLDISSIMRDVESFNAPSQFLDEPTFLRNIAPWIQSETKERGGTPREPINMNQELREKQITEAKELMTFDRDYRDIMSTVASLGSSIDAFKIQRYALGVAVLSLTVALITLVVAMLGSIE